MTGRTHNKGQKLADRGNKSLSHTAVSLLKTQDAGYLRTMLQQTRKERERLEQEVVLGNSELNALSSSVRTEDNEFVETRKILYVDSPRKQLPPLLEDNISDMDDLNVNRDQLREQRSERNRKRRARAARVSKLIALKEREAAFVEAEQELELQRAKMGNNIGGINKNGVRWKVKGRKK